MNCIREFGRASQRGQVFELGFEGVSMGGFGAVGITQAGLVGMGGAFQTKTYKGRHSGVKGHKSGKWQDVLGMMKGMEWVGEWRSRSLGPDCHSLDFVL